MARPAYRFRARWREFGAAYSEDPSVSIFGVVDIVSACSARSPWD